MLEFNHRKAIQALNFFATKEGDVINKMKAIKLIWLSDRLHLRKHGRPIIHDSYYALPYGPIPTTTRNILEEKVNDPIKSYAETIIETKDKYNYQSIGQIDWDVFSESDLEIMKTIYNRFGDLKEFDLSELSHDYPEWKKFESDIKNGFVKSYSMDYLDFFKNGENNDSIFSQDESLLKLTKEIFEETNEIRQLFK